MKYILFVLSMLVAGGVSATELCGEDLEITAIGNFSLGSGGPYIGDLSIKAGGKYYEWRTRYGLEQKLLDQTMSLALYAKAASRKVDIYCTVSEQIYNARYIEVK